MPKKKIGPGLILISSWLSTCLVLGQTASPSGSKKFEITDNSFLIEEAFNQERGVVQHIFTLLRSRGRANDPNRRDFSFTQEWPLGGMKHQFSYVLPYTSVDNQTSDLGDMLLNYRFQAANEEEHGVAIAPRLSLILPTGDEYKGLGESSAGVQFNLPVSKQVSDIYFHFNTGGTLFPGSESGSQIYHVGGSAIWRALPRLNLLTELIALAEKTETGSRTIWEYPVLVVPGFRTAVDVGSTQLVWGVGVPLSLSKASPPRGLFLYFSIEHPFR